MRNPVPLAAALTLAVLPASAGETAWTGIMPGTRLRLISNDSLAGGKTWIGLEIDMPANTRTYWRIPGETGIPTRIEVTAAGLRNQKILWPMPTPEQTGGFLDYVYAGPVVLPVELELSQSGAVSAAITMGICEEVCVPVSVNLTLPIDFSKPDRGQDIRLRQALSAVPIPWEGDKGPIGRVRFDPGQQVLAVEVDPVIADPASLIVDNGDPALLFGMPQKSPESGIFYLKLLDRGQNRDLRGEAVRLTFLTAGGAFEVNRTVE